MPALEKGDRLYYENEVIYLIKPSQKQPFENKIPASFIRMSGDFMQFCSAVATLNGMGFEMSASGVATFK